MDVNFNLNLNNPNKPNNEERLDPSKSFIEGKTLLSDAFATPYITRADKSVEGPGKERFEGKEMDSIDASPFDSDQKKK